MDFTSDMSLVCPFSLVPPLVSRARPMGGAVYLHSYPYCYCSLCWEVPA